MKTRKQIEKDLELAVQERFNYWRNFFNGHHIIDMVADSGLLMRISTLVNVLGDYEYNAFMFELRKTGAIEVCDSEAPKVAVDADERYK